MLQLSLFACLIILISAHTDAEHLDPMHYPMCSDKNIGVFLEIFLLKMKGFFCFEFVELL